MPLITVSNLTKYYGTELILDHISFAIDHRERLGLIGANGTGKTTLCRILMGQESYEEDSVIHKAQGMSVGYLSQDVDFGQATTPWEVAMSVFPQMLDMEQRLTRLSHELAETEDPARRDALLEDHSQLQMRFEAEGGHEFERRAARVLSGLGIPNVDFHRDLLSFSGGEQRRAALAQILLRQPDLLLLDEPTNHLDISGIEWLEAYLRDYPGAVVAISHDRRFLDGVAGRILELECRVLNEYTGGYSAFVQQKEQRLLTYERQYERQQDELKRQLSFIRWALGTQQEKKVRAAKSRLKLLEKMEYLDPPPSQRRKINLRFQPKARGGDEVLELTDVGMRYDQKRLFSGINVFVRRGERVGIVGPNGCGKTTLLRVIVGEERPTEGQARLGRSVHVGYHRQAQFGLNPENDVYHEFAQVAPDADPGEVRSLLARFLFVEDDVCKRVGDLSGGEQSRLSLAKLIMSRPTVLVLDEPTNHLDIDSRNSLEAALKDYQGTIIVVSHDRHFLDAVVRRVVVFAGGTATVHTGNYGAYAAQKQAKEEEARRLEEERGQVEKRRRQEEERRARRAKKASGDSGSGRRKGPSVEELEERVHYIEGQLAKVTAILGDPQTYSMPQRAEALGAEHEKLTAELTQAYTEWEEAVSALEAEGAGG